jgi:hypothetical protein
MDFVQEMDERYKKDGIRIARDIVDVKEMLKMEQNKLDEIQTMQKQFERQIEEERERRKVLEESTIPALVNSTELTRKTYEADLAVQVRRAVAAGVVQEDR